jgi:hypothetical protein
MIKHKFFFCVVGVLLCTSIYVDAASAHRSTQLRKNVQEKTVPPTLEKKVEQIDNRLNASENRENARENGFKKMTLLITGLFNQIKPLAELVMKKDLSEAAKKKREREYEGKRCSGKYLEISHISDNQNCKRKHHEYTAEESCRLERCRLKRNNAGIVPFLVQPFIPKNEIGCLKRNWEDLQTHLSSFCDDFKARKGFNRNAIKALEGKKELFSHVCDKYSKKSVSEESKSKENIIFAKSYEELIKVIKPHDGLLYKDMKTAITERFGETKNFKGEKIHHGKKVEQKWKGIKKVFYKQTFCGPKTIQLPLNSFEKSIMKKYL